MSTAPELAPHAALRQAWGVVRILTAVGIGYAVVMQFTVSLDYATTHEQHVPTMVSNFFSFFTILSNITGAVVFLLGGIWLLARGRRPGSEPRWLSLALLCASTYMIITGVVYNLLLRGIDLPQGATFPLGNEIMHLAGPAMFLLDVLLRVARRRQPARWVWFVVIFPIAWVLYTLIRGEHITNPATGAPWWYPYPFLNPYAQPEGYLSVAGWVVAIAAAFVAVGLGAAWWSRVGRRTTPSATEPEKPQDVTAA